MTTVSSAPTFGTLLIVPQGYTHDLAGQALLDVLVLFHEMSIAHLKAAQSPPIFARPFWSLQPNVPLDRRPALGGEQYAVQPDGSLGPRVTNCDSSD